MASIVRRTYAATTPDGKSVRRKYRHYSIRYTDAAGRRVWAKGFTDKGATAQLAARLESAAARGEMGLTDPFAVHKRRPLAEHLDDWLADLTSKGRDDAYRRTCRYRLTLLAEACGWTTLGQVESNAFLRWRDHARTNPRTPGTRKPVAVGEAKPDKAVASARTLNQYRETAVAFLNWCLKHKRLPHNPLAGVAKVDGETVRNRRALTVAEVAELIRVAPAERRLVWETLLTTGLRVQEAADLQWQDVRLDHVTRPFLALRMSAVKSRRAQALPLRPDLAAKLAAHRPAAFSPTGRVFASVPSLKLWKQDLKAAGIAYRDAAGRQVDRHAMRTTLGTRLAQSGVSPRVSMAVMRHSTIALTMKNYTDASLLDVTGAVDLLPPVGGPAATTGDGSNQSSGTAAG